MTETFYRQIALPLMPCFLLSQILKRTSSYITLYNSRQNMFNNVHLLHSFFYALKITVMNIWKHGMEYVKKCVENTWRNNTYMNKHYKQRNNIYYVQDQQMLVCWSVNQYTCLTSSSKNEASVTCSVWMAKVDEIVI